MTVVNVYSPAWPVDRSRLSGVDVGPVRLKLNRDVWVADLLWASLSPSFLQSSEYLVVGGDFNLSETFDAWKGGARGNREYLDRMIALGFAECLRGTTDRLTPTFRNPRGGAVVHQMDHLFVNQQLRMKMTSCTTGDPGVVFGESLSDHLPIVADFVLD